MASKQPDWFVAATDEYLLRLFITTKKLGLKYVLRIFNQHFPKHQDKALQGRHLYQQMSHYQATLNRVLLPYQRNILFGSASQETWLDDLDLSLLIKILQQTSDPQLRELKKLQEFRNWLAHQGSNSTIPESLFLQKFSVLKANLITLGATNEEVEYFKTANLDFNDSKKLEAIKDLMQQLKDEEKATVADLVLQPVLDIVAKEIHDDWKVLATSLKVRPNLILDYDKSLSTTEEKMKRCFEAKFNNISWKELKNQLIKINREDVVKMLCASTYLTTELQEAANLLKDHYNSQNNLKENFHCNLMLRHTTRRRKGILKQNASPVIVSEDMETKDFINKNDSVILLRGAGGSGKTTFINKLSQEWAQNNVYTGKDNDANVKFLFYLSCQELNEIQASDNLYTLIERKHRNLFSKISFENIHEFSGGILIFIDGLTELTKSETSRDMYRIVHEHLKSGLNRDKLCIASRFGLTSQLFDAILQEKINVKIVDVIGFDKTNIDRFINSYYSHNENKCNAVKHMINENSDLRSMSSVPAFLRILCNLANTLDSMAGLNTCTSLCLTAILIFIQDYNEIQDLANLPMTSLCSNKMVIKAILCLANLSFLIMKEGRNYFSEKELGKNHVQVVDGGLFLKFDTNDGYYRFKDLPLSDFFCALYIFLMGADGLNILGKIDLGSSIWNVLPTVAGLYGIFRQHQKTKPFLHTLLSNLIKSFCKLKQFLKVFIHPKEYTQRQLSVNEKDAFNFIISKAMYSFGDTSKNLVINESWIPILRLVYEYQSALPESLKNFVENKTCINLSIKFHYQIRFVAHLFNLLDVDHIRCCDINMTSNSLSDGELEFISCLLIKCEKIRIWNTTLNWQLFLKIVLSSNVTFFSLKTLVLNGCELNQVDKSYLLQYIPLLSSFMVANINFTKDETKLLAGNILIAINQRIAKLSDVYFWRCNLSNEAFDEFTRAIPYLKDFAIALNSISTKSMQKLSASLKNTPRSSRLYLSIISCGLTDIHVRQLQGCLHHIKELVLYGNTDMTAGAFKQISDELVDRAENYNDLRSTGLGFSHLTDEHVKVLSHCCPYLSGLSLYKCHLLTLDSFQTILTAFETCSSRKRSKVDVTLDKSLLSMKDILAINLKCYLNLYFEEDLLESIL
ncbi:uncharacterized protein LOC130655282 [Hydractinia symbiolongicarpus]|uniref:uncharacterized protein LOC130655282 n=1 Tax=Hydractinia symbiolongicarpus TaxID=13093 RepID=UPI00254CF15A|nr:uncharacterized protein LOC130655282 [Hydractinia symbiolongicarpus]